MGMGMRLPYRQPDILTANVSCWDYRTGAGGRKRAQHHLSRGRATVCWHSNILLLIACIMVSTKAPVSTTHTVDSEVQYCRIVMVAIRVEGGYRMLSISRLAMYQTLYGECPSSCCAQCVYAIAMHPFFFSGFPRRLCILIITYLSFLAFFSVLFSSLYFLAFFGIFLFLSSRWRLCRCSSDMFLSSRPCNTLLGTLIV